MAQVQAPGEPLRFGHHHHQDGRVRREILCRKCGRWMVWKLPQPEPAPAGPDGRFTPEQGDWFHQDDATPECAESVTLGH